MATSGVNSLFLGFLSQLYKETKAMESMARYPIPLTCGRDALVLDGVGEYISQKLDEKLREYLRKNVVVDKTILASPVAQKMRKTPSKSPDSFGDFSHRSQTVSSPTILSNKRRADTYRDEDDDLMPPPPPKRIRLDDSVLKNSNTASATTATKSSSKKGVHVDDSSEVENSKEETANYNPKKYSGGWAILIALHHAHSYDNFVGNLSQPELVDRAKKFSTTSFEAANGSFYSAWNSMKTLLKHDLVERRGRPMRYSLTAKGLERAKELFDRECEVDGFLPKYNSIIPPPLKDSSTTTSSSAVGRVSKPKAKSSSSQPASNVSFVSVDDDLPPVPKRKERKILNEISDLSMSLVEDYPMDADVDVDGAGNHSNLSAFEISDQPVLPPKFSFSPLNRSEIKIDQRITGEIVSVKVVVDSRERKAGSRSFLTNGLSAKGITCESRSLELGDVVWLGVTREGVEVVLDVVLERKTIADICSSIVDGRYAEQKFRLRKCGAATVIYLIEGSLDSSIEKRYSTINSQTIEKAMRSTAAEGFVVKHVLSAHESIEFIARVSNKVKENYLRKTVKGALAFEDFQSANGKNSDLSVTEIFAQQLISLFQISGEKAFAITSKYPTASHLIRAYDVMSSDEDKKRMLEDIRCGASNRRLGPNISSLVFSVFCSSSYPDPSPDLTADL